MKLRVDSDRRISVSTNWRKSTYSNPHGECVELAALLDGEVAVRNSRDPAGAVLIIGQAELAALVGGIKAGELGAIVARR